MHKDFFIKYQTQLDVTLNDFFSREILSTRKHDRFNGEIVKQLRDFTMRRGAKRIRGMLVLLGFLTNPKNKLTKDIFKVAAAYEILHSYLLIHDDIIDQDEERRGKPTLHVLFKKFAPLGSSVAEKKKIGEDIAIIIGDLANVFFQKLLLETSYSVNTKVQIQKYINNVLETTCGGQIIDILSLPNKLLSLKQQQSRYLQKTAIYTIEAPFLVGLSFGKGSINKRLFRKFANNVGLAFQLADDVHNIFGSSLATRQSDLQEGKVTYLISLAIKSVKYKKLILNILKKNKKNKHDLIKLRVLLIKSGGYQRAMSIIIDNFNQAEEILEKLVLPEYITSQLKFFLNKLKQKLPETN